ncbi:hypothetical protein [Gilvimarinus japonicus]|uniref:Uncharacterized protein n=1 Tax=Gilvimarinus japonicus TaxID=1796469 RepID=A0ABV7HN73_9GAMM
MNTHHITVTEKGKQFWAECNGITVTTADSAMNAAQTLIEGLRPSLHNSAAFFVVNKTEPHMAEQGTHTFIVYELCGRCKKRDFQDSTGCHMPAQLNQQGEWQCERFNQGVTP